MFPFRQNEPKKWKQRHLLDHLGDHKGTLLIKDFGQDLQT